MSYCVLSTCIQGVCIILNLTTNYHANYNDRGLQNIPVFLALECLFCRLQSTPRMQIKAVVNVNLWGRNSEMEQVYMKGDMIFSPLFIFKRYLERRYFNLSVQDITTHLEEYLWINLSMFQRNIFMIPHISLWTHFVVECSCFHNRYCTL